MIGKLHFPLFALWGNVGRYDSMQGASFIYTCPASIHEIGNVHEWRPIAGRKKASADHTNLFGR